MKKVLYFICLTLLWTGLSDAAVRDGTAVSSRGRTTQSITSGTASQQRVATVSAKKTTGARVGTTTSTRLGTTARTTNTKTTSTRPGTTARTTTSRQQGGTTTRTNATTTARTGISARATEVSSMSETRTGAEYEQCKNAYFTCMDQFCMLKNDDYRRCSCSNRVYDLTEQRTTLQDAGQQLTVFTENLDAVGMTAEQATAMRTASEGENALTSDTSASKALLQAIMNSIRGEDSSVGGKFSDLNSITLITDTTNAFGMSDTGQIIASYNGKDLYSAVYSQCRSAVRADCNDASLQRAITAYLMAIEQDCNTVQSAVDTLQKQMKSSVREGSAMLDLARVENRKNHNSDTLSACIGNVESAILSEEVCGANYHKCLDNGEFIDVSTGQPIAGIENFYQLGQLLTFADGVDSANQQLSKISSNRTFVLNFESRTKKFAEPALDKCTEDADFAWSEYLDKALLDIYYAQKAKVSEIQEQCFDYITECYANNDSALSAAMSGLDDDLIASLLPTKIDLSHTMCDDYINSCNAMFGATNIITAYVENRKNTDKLDACRTIVKQCFASFGGTGYENFYYPASGIFKEDAALDWFSLYDKSKSADKPVLVSPCAKQLQEIDSCADNIETIFGGLDKIPVKENRVGITYEIDNTTPNTRYEYGLVNTGENKMTLRNIRTTGVATEVYNQIIDNLKTQCDNVQGRFVTIDVLKTNFYDGCIIKNPISGLTTTTKQGGENVCPRDYESQVATTSWGYCLCTENGLRRSKHGTSQQCVAEIPTDTAFYDKECDPLTMPTGLTLDNLKRSAYWCKPGLDEQGNTKQPQPKK